MSDYTPTTEDVRNGFANNEFIKSGHNVAYLMEFAGEYQAQFDRWLAQHDAEVARAERERIVGLLKAHVYNQSIYLCSCQNDDDYPNTMGVDGWAEHVALIKGENDA